MHSVGSMPNVRFNGPPPAIDISDDHPTATFQRHQEEPQQSLTDEPIPISEIPISDLHTFVMAPAPRGAPYVNCLVMRHKSLFTTTAYELFTENNYQVVACTKKCRQAKHSSYKIACGASLRKDEVEFIGKLKSNGTLNCEYTLHGPGISSKKLSIWDDDFEEQREEVRKQVGKMTYVKPRRS